MKIRASSSDSSSSGPSKLVLTLGPTLRWQTVPSYWRKGFGELVLLEEALDLALAAVSIWFEAG